MADKKRGAFSTVLEAYSAYNNPYMWAADKIIPEVPVVGPIYDKGKDFPKKIAKKWLSKPPPGWNPPQMGKQWRGRWPRGGPAVKEAKRPIGKMGPGFPIGAMPLVAFQKRNWPGSRLGPNRNARPALRPTEDPNRKKLAQQVAAKVARYPWMSMGRWGIVG